MSDIRDWNAFIRGRWNWTSFGYEEGFVRGCQFTDIDAAIEFDGHRLVIEAKHYDGTGYIPDRPRAGQSRLLRDEVQLGKTVFVLFGNAPVNDPFALWIYGRRTPDDILKDWRPHKVPSQEERRRRFKAEIDHALGVSQPIAPAASPHNSCDCQGHMGFHIDCDEYDVLCFCQPIKVG